MKHLLTSNFMCDGRDGLDATRDAVEGALKDVRFVNPRTCQMYVLWETSHLISNGIPCHRSRLRRRTIHG